MPENRPQEQNTQQPEELKEETAAVEPKKGARRKFNEFMGFQKTKKTIPADKAKDFGKLVEESIKLLNAHNISMKNTDFCNVREDFATFIKKVWVPNNGKISEFLEKDILEYVFEENANIKLGGNSNTFLLNFKDLNTNIQKLGNLSSDAQFGEISLKSGLSNLKSEIEKIYKILGALKDLLTKISKDDNAALFQIKDYLRGLLIASTKLIDAAKKGVEDSLEILKISEKKPEDKAENAPEDSDDKKSGDKKAEEKAKK